MRRFPFCFVAICFVAFCFSASPLTPRLSADDWAQWRGASRNGVWNEKGIVTEFSKEDVKPIWRQPIGTGYSSPTVADGKVLLMDYDADKKEESIRCFDAESGKLIWQYAYKSVYTIGYQAGPRAAVTISDGMTYSLGAMGHLHCHDLATGRLVWNRDLDKTYKISESKRMPIWGIAASPLVHDDKLILQIGAKDATVVALNKTSGEEIWKSLDDRGQYSSPVLIKQNSQDVVVCWTGDSVAGLNPTTGEAYWREPFTPSRMPIGVATPVINGNKIFLTSFYDGAMMLELTDMEMGIKKLWHLVGPNEKQGVTKAIHSMIGTPVWIGDHIYGVDSHGEVRCIQASDGKRVWEDTTAVKNKRWATIHFVPNGDNIWMLNEEGELMLGKLSTEGLTVSSREKVLGADQMRTRNRKDGVCWSHPAFANKCFFARNDKEIICISLAKE